MVFGFFAVEGEGGGLLGLSRKGNRGGARQRDSLIGWTIEHIGFLPCRDQGFGIKFTKPSKPFTGIKQPRIEKIRASAT